MSKGFQNASKAFGVPLFACPENGSYNGTKCDWHTGRRYASSSWISYELYGEGGVEIYNCNRKSCDKPGLLLVYNPATTVFGAAFVADGNTDIDPFKNEGVTKDWMPPVCS